MPFHEEADRQESKTVVYLKDRVTRGVSAHRELQRIERIDLIAQTQDICDNYEEYALEDALFSFGGRGSKSYYLEDLEELRSEHEKEEKLTDEKYLHDVVFKVRMAWKGGRVSFVELATLASTIKNLIRIDESIPWVEGQNPRTSRYMLATWIYDNCGKLWVPVDENDIWEQLQNLYRVFIQENVQEHVKARWDVLNRSISSPKYRELPTVQFITKDEWDERLIQRITDTVCRQLMRCEGV